MRERTIELKVNLGATGSIAIGSLAETDWVVDKITFFGMDEHAVVLICDCIHVEDYKI